MENKMCTLQVQRESYSLETRTRSDEMKHLKVLPARKKDCRQCRRHIYDRSDQANATDCHEKPKRAPPISRICTQKCRDHVVADAVQKKLIRTWKIDTKTQKLFIRFSFTSYRRPANLHQGLEKLEGSQSVGLAQEGGGGQDEKGSALLLGSAFFSKKLVCSEIWTFSEIFIRR